MEILLETNNLSIEYRNIEAGKKTSLIAVNNVDFKIYNGEIYALECNPFFENLDIELFTRAIENDIANIFETA